MTYRVERDNGTNGFSCHFECNGRKYFARVCFVPLSGGSECIISSEDTIDMMYGMWNVPVTKEGLISCIEEFAKIKKTYTYKDFSCVLD